MMRYLSLFSGMEAAHLAWAPLGWECVAVAEIDAAPCAVLAHRLPGVPNLGSVIDISAARVKQLGRIDVVIGGSPCQDLSVAGRRAGLAGARSGLFFEQLRIFDAARHLCGARWLVWENVPGAFSSNEGRDFAVVAGAMAGLDLDVPEEGWGAEGVALGANGLLEWSVLDAQWFGVAQRRRRVFAVLDTGNWADRPPVLLEPDRLRGNSAPRREAWEGAAGSLAASSGRRGGVSEGERGGLIPGLARCVTTGKAKRQDFETCTIIGVDLQNVALTGDATGTLDAEGQSRGNRGHAVLAFDTTQITSAENRCNPLPGAPCHPLAAGAHPPAIAFGCKDSDPARGLGQDVAPTLRAMQHDGSHANAGGQVAIAITGDVAHALNTANNGKGCSEDGAGRGVPTIAQAMAVRRLTPRECERLQGATDNWTQVPRDGKPMADGPRYKMLGNSFAVPVVRWVGEQIARAHASAELERAA